MLNNTESTARIKYPISELVRNKACLMITNDFNKKKTRCIYNNKIKIEDLYILNKCMQIRAQNDFNKTIMVRGSNLCGVVINQHHACHFKFIGFFLAFIYLNA